MSAIPLLANTSRRHDGWRETDVVARLACPAPVGHYCFMGTVGDKWLGQVERNFGFVRGFGFSKVDVDDTQTTSLGGPWVDYRSRVAVIRVRKSYEDYRCMVTLIELVDGKVPPHPIWVTATRRPPPTWAPTFRPSPRACLPEASPEVEGELEVRPQ